MTDDQQHREQQGPGGAEKRTEPPDRTGDPLTAAAAARGTPDIEPEPGELGADDDPDQTARQPGHRDVPESP
jgi:hypothetical protein